MTDLPPLPSVEPASKAADQKFCFSCGSVLHLSASSCPKCGALQPAQTALVPVPPLAAMVQVSPSALPHGHVYCRGCGQPIHESAISCPKCGALQRSANFATARSASGNDRMTAALLALFLGGLGGHKFYLGQTGMGILYLLFCWTLIPALIAFIEGIIFLTMSDADFAAKY